MCKKQTSVSHSSTEAELLTLDAGLRMDGISALDLWDLGMGVFHSSPTQSKKTKDQARGNSSRDTTSNKHTQNKGPTKHNNLELSSFVQREVFFTWCDALHFFEENEAVIEMIIKGRSPTMRHVSRTHRVALDWLLGTLTHTKNQLADTLTKGNFTRDEWNNLLHLFNISQRGETCRNRGESVIMGIF